jgi:hypothetical protein
MFVSNLSLESLLSLELAVREAELQNQAPWGPCPCAVNESKGLSLKATTSTQVGRIAYLLFCFVVSRAVRCFEDKEAASHVGALISLWLFLFAAQPKRIFLTCIKR